MHPTCLVLSSARLANQILFCNHRNRKLVGGKHNILIHYLDASAPDSSGYVLCNPFKWDILCSYLIKNHLVIFVHATTANRIPFCNRRNRKVVGGKHNILIHYLDVSAPDSSGYVLCNPFKWDILCSYLLKMLHNSEMNLKTYPYLPVDVCCIETPTNHFHTTFVKINQYSLYFLLSFLYIKKSRNKHTIPHYTVRYFL